MDPCLQLCDHNNQLQKLGYAQDMHQGHLGVRMAHGYRSSRSPCLEVALRNAGPDHHNMHLPVRAWLDEVGPGWDSAHGYATAHDSPQAGSVHRQ